MLPCFATLPDTLTWREKLCYLAVRFRQADEAAQDSCPVEHEWRDGKYFRTMRIPAGTLFIGRTHLHGHLCELLEGEVVLIYQHCTQTRRAPDSLMSVPGYQMALYAVTDVIGRTTHPDTGERDIEKAEGQIFEPLSDLIATGEAVRKRLGIYYRAPSVPVAQAVRRAIAAGGS